jgi:FkbM family methyltransferase
MNLRATAVRITHSNRAGLFAIKAARQTMNFASHLLHPDLPLGQMTSKVTSNGRTFTILHRRTYADQHVVKQCFAEGQYNMPHAEYRLQLQQVYDQIVASGRTPLIIDCGANIGCSVLWFLSRYPKAHLLAFEPAPDNFDLLSKNCAGLDVDLRQAGVSSTDGAAHLSDPGEGGWGYRTDGDTGVEVPMLALAPLLAAKIEAGYVPFLLKIDIEGGEKTLFASNTTPLNQFPMIIIEPHDWMLPGQGSSIEFFRFHAAAGREFCMNNENVYSIAFQNVVS